MHNPDESSPDFHFLWHLAWMVRKTGEGCRSGCISFSTAHLGTLVSSSQIFYLASFQEGQRPRMSHLTHSIGQSLTKGQCIQREEMQTPPLLIGKANKGEGIDGGHLWKQGLRAHRVISRNLKHSLPIVLAQVPGRNLPRVKDKVNTRDKIQPFRSSVRHLGMG